MATINLGKVRITFGGTFDNTKSYDILTVVDNPYKVKYISISAAPVSSSLADTTIWEPLSGYFVEQYQGSGATDPTTRIDSTPLQTGDLFFNTTLNEMRVYTGVVWKSAGSTVNGTSKRQSFTATSGQTTFTISGGYSANFADVYLNGSKLVNGTDVDVTSGTDVVLATGATAGDIVDVVAYGDFKVANTVDLNSSQTISGIKTFTSSPAIPDATASNEPLSKGQLLAAIKAIDGSGSGLDADLLDGKQGSFYLPAGNYTAADVLAKIKTVDGSGSGLDADTVDGVQGALLGVGGAGYTWVDETANRASGTTYTNTYGKPIMVSISIQTTTTVEYGFSVNGTRMSYKIGRSGTSSGIDVGDTIIVPSASTYNLIDITGSIEHWFELK